MANFRTPAFAYPGGKARLANRIVGMLDIGAKRYVDVFAGRGNVFFAAASLHYEEYWLNDPVTAKFFLALMSWDSEILLPDYVTKNVFKEYRQKFYKGNERERLNAILLEPYLSYSGFGYKHNGARVGVSGVTPEGYARNLKNAKAILHRTNPLITEFDWKDAFKQLRPDDMVFLDPPYVDAYKNMYECELKDQEDLAIALKTANFRWLLTEYENNIYVKHLGKPCRKITVPIVMDNSAALLVGRHYETECIWKNY